MQCKICLYDDSIADVEFNEEGVCNYCTRHELLEKEYPNDKRVGRKILTSMFDKIRNAGKGKRYDCIIGISGGCDSSFLLDLICRNGIRPLSVHFDNVCDTEIAKHNMECVCQTLNVDIIYRKVEPSEFDDIVRSFLFAGVIDIDAASDIGMITVLYQEAEKQDVSYILDGHSFRTEGIQPISWAYVDGKYISAIHDKFGRLPMKTFPNLWYEDFVRWVDGCGIQRIRPLYHAEYVKSEAKKYLKETYGWKDYGGHHLENAFTAFNYTYFLPKRVGIDERVHEFSALIRSGQMDKSVALKELNKPLAYSEELVNRVRNRLGLDETFFDKIMMQPLKSYVDYPTYKKQFETDEVFWRRMYEIGRVPKSFYLKYCSSNFM